MKKNFKHLVYGAKYKDRGGREYGPMIESGSETYPFKCAKKGETWTKKGRFCTGEKFPFDLVELVSLPGTQAQKRKVTDLGPIQITKTAARAAYEQAPAKMKSTLETLFGKENLLPADITERVETFEDACEVRGLDPGNILSATVKDEKAHKHVAPLEAFLKLRIISEALNEGWEPDWSNSTQYKHYPIFENTGSGFRFDYSDRDCQYSSVGSRLCFKSSKLSDYAGTQFCDLYNQMYSL